MRQLVKNVKQRGFTFPEVLLVVAVIAIVAAIAIIAINPGRQLGQARNSQRQTDVNTVINALYQYSLDNNGAIPTGVTTSATEICATGAASCMGLVDLSVLTTNDTYLTSLPKDPRCTTTCAANGTGYKILKTANNRMTISAPAAEQGKTISVTR